MEASDLVCRMCGTQKGHAWGTGDCGCEYDSREPMYITYDEYVRRQPTPVPPTRWITQWLQVDGQLIDLKDMGDQHLRNTIAMLRGNTADDELILGQCYGLAGSLDPDSMASYYADHDLDRMEQQIAEKHESWRECIASMESELASRQNTKGYVAGSAAAILSTALR